MAGRPQTATQHGIVNGDIRGVKSYGTLDADIIIANAPDPVFVSDLEGKILQANDAVSQLLGFRQDEVLEQSLSRFISPEDQTLSTLFRNYDDVFRLYSAGP